MRVTLLGHACLLVESDGARLLVDPLLFNPGERTLDPCPRRIIHREQLGRFDAIVISHGHRDHFDIESLMRLPRNLPVLTPQDAELAARLQRLGFADVRILAPWGEARLGGLRVVATPSRPDLLEMGVVFADASGSVWDQVDTVVAQATCVGVGERLGRLDVCFAAYNPLLEHATSWVDEVDFPQARYERLLEMAICSRARLLIPGSFGLRITGRYEYFNQRCYPVSRERFLRDLRSVAPEIDARPLLPGQAVELRAGAAPEIVDTPYATCVEDDTARVAFAPERAPVPPLVDDNPTRIPERELGRTVEHLVTTLFVARCNELLAAPLVGPLATLKHRRARVDLEIVFPRGMRRWRIAQWIPTVAVVSLADAADAEAADYTFTYVASQLTAAAQGTPYREPEVRARRRRGSTTSTFRFSALAPARLAGVDPTTSVDEGFSWNPLAILAP